MGKAIEDYKTCHIFAPKWAKGKNGVMLTEYLGIASIEELLAFFDEESLRQDIVIN
jgi:hypothetical protein